MPQGIEATGAVSANDVLYVAGGNTGGTAVNFLQTYTPDDIAWASGDTSVSTIDRTGNAAALVPGTSTITASSLTVPTVQGNTLLTVIQATPVFSALTSPTIVYGTASTTLSGKLALGTHIPTGSVSITVNSVTQSAAIVAADGSFTSTFATNSLGVSGSPYTITYSYAGDTLFASASDTTKTLTVTPANLTITADNKTKVYGAALPALTASYSGFVNGQTATNLTTQPTLTTTATAASHVGSYTITASAAADPNYIINYVQGTLTVTAANLTITADSKSMPYGGPLPALTVSYSGFVNGDSSATLSVSPNTAPTIVTAATAASHVAGSPYSVTASGAMDTDYKISYVAGTLKVNPASLNITANNQTKVYGAPLPALTVSYSGFVNGDTAASLTTPPAISTAATAASHFGTYPITASAAADADYMIGYAAGTLTVNPASLNITANNQTKVYGAPLPALTVSYSGFVNGDTAASLTTPPTITTAATAAGHVGNYTITASGAVDGDYMINYTAGALTVTSASTSITTSNTVATYGDAAVMLTAAVTDSSSYSTATVNEGTVTFTVMQGTTVIGSFVTSGTVSGGTVTATFPLGITVNAGNYNVQATYNPASSNPNFKTSSTTGTGAGTLTVGRAATIATVTTSSLSFQYSDPVTFTVTLQPLNPNIYVNLAPPATGTITFSVGPSSTSGVPANAQTMGQCTLMPNNANQLTCSVAANLLEATYPPPSPNNMAPGPHTVYAKFSTLNSNFNVTDPVTSTMTIKAEDARVTYAGNLFYGIPQTSATGSITLVATISDITALCDPSNVPAGFSNCAAWAAAQNPSVPWDPNAGDIRNATVTFVDRSNNATLCSAPVLLINSSDTKTGSVTCPFTGIVGNTGSTQYTVGIVVSGYYSRNMSTDNAVVTISQVGPGMITGGGYQVMKNSAGTIAGDPGTHNNFGFNVQYKSSAQNPHGNINSIVRRMENGIQHVYQIKGNSMSTLAVYQLVGATLSNGTLTGGTWNAGCTGATSTSPCKAQFNGNANIQDITNPLSPVSVTGNNSLQFNMTDYGTPGSGDTLGVTLWNSSGGTSGGIWFSTNWVGTPPATVEQLLGGGNLVVH
jgi:hypothetical protein